MAAGRGRSRTVKRAVRFLVRHQNADGGFPLLPGGASNAQSTAWAVQGLLAAGRDPAKVRRDGSRDPLAYLRSLTAAGGEVRYSRTSRQTPVWVTGQALTALARKPLPLSRSPAPAAPRAAPTAPPRAGGHAARRAAAGAGRRTPRGRDADAPPGEARPAAARRPPPPPCRPPWRRSQPAAAFRAGCVAGLAAYAVM